MKTTNRKKIVSTGVFTLLLLCLTITQTISADPLISEKLALDAAVGYMNTSHSNRGHYYTDFWTKKSEFGANLEELQRDNLIDFVDIDPLGLFALRATVKSALDWMDHLILTIELHAAWSAANKMNDTLRKAVAKRDEEYQKLLDAAVEKFVSLSDEDLEVLRGGDPDPSVSKFAEKIGSVAEGMLCPNCNVFVTDAEEISSHVAPCSIPPHEGTRISHFVCNGGTCPLSHKHHVPCRGGCGELFRPPTYLSPPPRSQGAGSYVEIFYDHGYRCEVDVPGLGNCPKTAYTCQTPQCENDANHLKKAPCGKHTVLESAFSQHEALPNGHARKGRCTYTHNFEGTPYQCIVMITHRCDLGHGSGLANQHDFNPAPNLVYPAIAPEPEPISPRNNNVTCSVCSVSYDPGSSSANDHALQASCSTDTNCISTNFYACDNHTHEYPPTTVSCRRSACTASVSSSDEHRVGPCSACGRSYWSCGPNAAWSESQHRFRTCRRSGCDNTWRRCQGDTPNCNASPGQGCWAQ